MARTGICGTDLHIRSWDASAQAMVTPPIVVGHEIAGHVEAIGPGVDSINVGDLVSVEGHIGVRSGAATAAPDGGSCALTPRASAFTATAASPSSSSSQPETSGGTAPTSTSTSQQSSIPFGNAVHSALSFPRPR